LIPQSLTRILNRQSSNKMYTHCLIKVACELPSLSVVIDNHKPTNDGTVEPVSYILEKDWMRWLSDRYPNLASVKQIQVPIEESKFVYFKEDLYQGISTLAGFWNWLLVRNRGAGAIPEVCTRNAVRLLKLLGYEISNAPTVAEVMDILEAA
jgi:hypothetical protein